MQSCDVLIVGGGPAGSTCAWQLRRAGAEVVLMDRAVFPRDKVCAGWITPQVVSELEIDVDDYRQGRVWQPFAGIRVGLIDGAHSTAVTGKGLVGFGIRRLEFDDYLLGRAAVRTKCGAPLTSFARLNGQWVVNAGLVAPMLVGAGGYFCPVARRLNPPTSAVDVTASLVLAQEAEFSLSPSEASACAVQPEVPELYFCGDLKGYGWCVRKQRYLNVGLGRLDRHSLPDALARFIAFLTRTRGLPPVGEERWRGHAYLLRSIPSRRRVDEGVLLAGDAAAVAYPVSGEGILPAVESALLAAQTIAGARHPFATESLRPYADALQRRLGPATATGGLRHFLPPSLSTAAAAVLLRSRWFVRSVLLDRWFLHAN